MLYENNSPMYVLGFKIKIEKLEIYKAVYFKNIQWGGGNSYKYT